MKKKNSNYYDYVIQQTDSICAAGIVAVILGLAVLVVVLLVI